MFKKCQDYVYVKDYTFNLSFLTFLQLMYVSCCLLFGTIKCFYINLFCSIVNCSCEVYMYMKV